MRRKTLKNRNNPRSNVLHVHVWSSRLFWIGLVRFLYRSTQIACVLGILAGIAWGIKLGLQRAFYDNPDFRLQVVDLNPNPAMDESDFVKITGINLRANLFQIDLKAITKSLVNTPSIIDAHVERRLPGTLVVRVTARTPRAWIACPDVGISAERKVGNLLVDLNDVAYPCPLRQFEIAANLPVIVLPARNKETIAICKKVLQPELQRCLRLLTAAKENASELIPGIDSIQQANAWSLVLTTTNGTAATFGLGDHARQVSNFRVALNHAGNKGYSIATINLIPKENVPVTVNSGPPPPKAIPVSEPTIQEIHQDRRTRDLKSLLNRE